MISCESPLGDEEEKKLGCHEYRCYGTLAAVAVIHAALSIVRAGWSRGTATRNQMNGRSGFGRKESQPKFRSRSPVGKIKSIHTYRNLYVQKPGT